MQPRIIVLSGDRKNEVFVLTARDFVIGRDPGVDLVLTDPLLSRIHCAIDFEEGHYELHDCGSLNGTMLNGEFLTRHATLRHGDQFKVGNTWLAFLTGPEVEMPSPLELDETQAGLSGGTVLADSSLLLKAVLKAAHDITRVRDSAGIREKVLSLIFSFTPADRAALVLTGGGYFARERSDPGREVRFSSATLKAILENGPTISSDHSMIGAPLEIHEQRIGVLCAEVTGRDSHFDKGQLEMLAGVAAIAGMALDQATYTERVMEENDIPHKLVGDSAAMDDVHALIKKAAATNSTVLIRGESGTGKELVAHAIHWGSDRAGGPFIKVNCAAIPENLLESILFGYEKGAFTGAMARTPGKFQQANGGTIFLDEIGDLSPGLQTKILRVLQEREVDPLGSLKPIKIDIRVIAATHRDLKTSGFRPDLFYSLNVLPIRMPALRERPEDIPALARHFLVKLRQDMKRVVDGISPEAEKMLLNYSWPGNVRELQNVIERAVALGSGDLILPEDMPEEWHHDDAPRGLRHEVHDLRRTRLRNALSQAGGSGKHAAAILGISTSHFYRLCTELGIDIRSKADIGGE